MSDKWTVEKEMIYEEAEIEARDALVGTTIWLDSGKRVRIKHATVLIEDLDWVEETAGSSQP